MKIRQLKFLACLPALALAGWPAMPIHAQANPQASPSTSTVATAPTAEPGSKSQAARHQVRKAPVARPAWKSSPQHAVKKLR